MFGLLYFLLVVYSLKGRFGMLYVYTVYSTSSVCAILIILLQFGSRGRAPDAIKFMELPCFLCLHCKPTYINHDDQ